MSLSAGKLVDTDNEATHLNLPAGTLVWTWDIGIAAGQLFTGLNQASIQVVYNRVGPNNNIQQRLTSENITLQTVPEPSSLLLLGSGLLALGVAGRRFIG